MEKIFSEDFEKWKERFSDYKEYEEEIPIGTLRIRYYNHEDPRYTDEPFYELGLSLLRKDGQIVDVGSLAYFPDKEEYQVLGPWPEKGDPAESIIKMVKTTRTKVVSYPDNVPEEKPVSKRGFFAKLIEKL